MVLVLLNLALALYVGSNNISILHLFVLFIFVLSSSFFLKLAALEFFRRLRRVEFLYFV